MPCYGLPCYGLLIEMSHQSLRSLTYLREHLIVQYVQPNFSASVAPSFPNQGF